MTGGSKVAGMSLEGSILEFPLWELICFHIYINIYIYMCISATPFNSIGSPYYYYYYNTNKTTGIQYTAHQHRLFLHENDLTNVVTLIKLSWLHYFRPRQSVGVTSQLRFYFSSLTLCLSLFFLLFPPKLFIYIILKMLWGSFVGWLDHGFFSILCMRMGSSTGHMG